MVWPFAFTLFRQEKSCKDEIYEGADEASYVKKLFIFGRSDYSAGLMIKFEDSRLLTIKTSRDDEGVFWKTSTESVMVDYKYVDGVNGAHSGKTYVTVFRYGEHSANKKKQLEERWKIEKMLEPCTP